jgi:hypothetical protein
MNHPLSIPLEFERFNSLEFEGIGIGNWRGPFNCGEFAAIGAGETASNPVEFHGIRTSAPTRPPRTNQH